MTEGEAAPMLKNGSDGQALLQAYHFSPEWPAYIESLKRDLPDEFVAGLYDIRVAVRCPSLPHGEAGSKIV